MPAATRITGRLRRLPVFILTLFATVGVALVVALPASAAIVSTTTTLSLDKTSIALNESVTMTATVTASAGTAAPTGTVNFTSVATDGTTSIGTANLVVSGVATSTASFTTNSLSAGTYQVTANYGGAFLAFASSASTPKQLAVAGAVLHNTTTSLSADHTTITSGDDVTFSVHVAETDGVTVPTGTINFESISGGATSALGQATLDANGNATLTVGGWPTGNYTVLAEYTGDRFDHGSSAQLTLGVNSGSPQTVDTTTTVALSPATIQTNGVVQITATIVQSRTGAIPPAGAHVNFYATGSGSSEQVSIGQGDVVWNADGTAPASGTATITVSGWAAGFYTIEADFTGDIFDNASAGRASLGVTSQAPTTLTYTGNAEVAGGAAANVAFQLTSGGSPVAAEPVTIAVNGQSYAVTTDASGYASASVTLPAGTYAITSEFTGDGQYLASGGSGSVIVDKFVTTTAYTGDTQTGVGKTATLSATLTGPTSNPLGGKLVTLSYGTVSCQATTNLNGVASCTVTDADAPGSYTVTASFVGDGTYQPSSGIGSIVVAGLGLTSIADNVTGSFLQGSLATLSGTLTTNGAPLAGKTVALTLGFSLCTGVTNAAGVASCTVTVPGPTGPTLSTATFLGDAAFKHSIDAKPALIYATTPGGGSFVVGDRSATGTVTFWGSQWSKNNTLSGGAGDSSFKGFAKTVSASGCGATWTTDPGNSASPPNGPLPAYMAVAVTSKTGKSGKAISGTVVHVVIVKTNAGYDSNPGHPGTGTVVATLC
jgi:hypothetical protein